MCGSSQVVTLDQTILAMPSSQNRRSMYGSSPLVFGGGIWNWKLEGLTAKERLIKAPGRRAEMHFEYWWYWTSSRGIISFLFLSYFFPMTTRNGQIKNFTSNSGPQHPAAHGVSRSVLEMNGEVVERAEPHIGSLQCGTKPLTLSRLLCR
jgi:hypothetical protein